MGHQKFADELRVGDDDRMFRPHPQMHDVAIRLLPFAERAEQIARHSPQQVPASQAGRRPGRPGTEWMQRWRAGRRR